MTLHRYEENFLFFFNSVKTSQNYWIRASYEIFHTKNFKMLQNFANKNKKTGLTNYI